MRFTITATLVVALSPACAFDPPHETSESALGLGGYCGACSMNGVVADMPFWELNTKHAANTHGTVFVEARTKNGFEFSLSSENGVLLKGAGSEWKPVSVGAVITIDVYDAEAGTNELVDLTISEIGSASYWSNLSNENTTTYLMTYEDIDGNQRELCPEDDPKAGLPPHHLVVLTGERYFLDSITAEAGASADNWISFGCTGSALSKMHLIRHTEAGSDDQHKTSIDQRTIALKAFHADYCGKGVAHTVTGTPLAYLNAKGWLDNVNWSGKVDEVESIEALWTVDGAVCLTEHRLQKPECWLPKCEDLNDWQKAGYFLTANPLIP